MNIRTIERKALNLEHEAIEQWNKMNIRTIEREALNLERKALNMKQLSNRIK